MFLNTRTKRQCKLKSGVKQYKLTENFPHINELALQRKQRLRKIQSQSLKKYEKLDRKRFE